MGSRKVAIREHRDNQSRAPIPQSLESATLPRSIDIQTFYEARKLELDHFMQALSKKAAGILGNKQAFQLLPKHMRRRAMSHNAHRIPARIRTTKPLAAIKNPPRKRRRHTKNLLEDYNRRARKHVWLSTHIWHAKRMKMAELWNYKLALHPNDKSVRAVHRFAAHSCVVYDSSYYAAIYVKGQLVEDSCTHGFLGKGWVSYEGDWICPVEVIRWGEGQILFVHPSAYTQILQVLDESGLDYQDWKDQLVIYKLRGPKSSEVLCNALSFQNPHTEALLKTAAQFTNLPFPDKAVLGVDILKPKVQGKIPHAVKHQAQTIKPSQVPLEVLKELADWQDKSSTDLWQNLVPGKVKSQVPQHITTRSRKSRYPKPKQAAPVQEIRQISIQEEECLPGVLVYHQSQLNRGFSEGWDLMVSAEVGTQLFRNLVFSGAKAIGLRDYNFLLFEQGTRVFPDDFPQTLAYHEHSVSKTEELIASYFKKPSSKRVNYERIGMPFPFFPDFKVVLTQEAQLHPVQITSLSKIPKAGALLCQAFPEDFETTHTEPLHERTSKSSQLRDIQHLSGIEISRPLLGFLTSGGFSFIKRKGYGIGYINTEPSRIPYVLYRNPSSRNYHLCSVKTLN